MARSTAFLFLAFLLTATVPRINSALTCGQVVSLISPCIAYVGGGGPISGGCCAGVSKLKSIAATTPDRQTACRCVKMTIGSISGLKPDLLAGLPQKCRVSVPYAIKASMDCSKVN